jgi:vancomycin resistance protein VanJ
VQTNNHVKMPPVERRRISLGAKAVRVLRLVIACLSAVYGAVVVTIWVLLSFTADRWWPGTVLMFGPKWVWALPLIALVPLALLLRRRSIPLLLITGFILVLPISRLCIPWRLAFTANGEADTLLRLRVLTFNADHGKCDVDAFVRLIHEAQPDVVLLQDWWPRFNDVVFGSGWYHRQDGELCIASRRPLAETEGLGPVYPSGFGKRPSGSMTSRKLIGQSGSVHVVNLHLATPRRALEAVIDRGSEGAAPLQKNMDLRAAQSAAFRRVVDSIKGPVVVAGDFNTPTTSAIYLGSWGDLTNAFSTAGWGWGHTYVTGRAGIRIDHVLVDRNATVRKCWVGPHIGSEHRPVIADIEWRNSPRQ